MLISVKVSGLIYYTCGCVDPLPLKHPSSISGRELIKRLRFVKNRSPESPPESGYPLELISGPAPVSFQFEIGDIDWISMAPSILKDIGSAKRLRFFVKIYEKKHGHNMHLPFEGPIVGQY